MQSNLPPTLAWADRDGAACLRLTGLDIDAPRLAVLPGEFASADPTHQPMAGRFVGGDGVIDFIPRFPFLAGTAYAVVVAPGPDLPDGLTLSLQRERPAAGPAPTVLAIHPDVGAVPFNLLKVYVRFSAPMAEGAARRAVRVEDALTGQPLDAVFLDMDPELWDPERRRLTLLLDPGRIKRGLAPHEEAGYPLAEGAWVRIVIGPEFRGAAGAPLAAAISRVYAVGPALRRPVDPADWRWDLPGAGLAAPLTITFDRPLDHALLAHAFQVTGPDSAVVAGAGEAMPGETAWRFRPSAPWRGGSHQLLVRAHLEDLAGNSLRRVFDRDLTREADFVTAADWVALPFSPTSAPP